jgi:parallel beta-helix repeat protein
MFGSDYFIADSHYVGLPTPGLAEVAVLDPSLATLEQLALPATGWIPVRPASTQSQVTSVYIDPTASSAGKGTLAQPYNSWSRVTWAPATSYLQKAGTTWAGSITVTGSGTAKLPIVLGSYGTGAAPAIRGSVVFQGASYVALTGFTVESSFAAVIIEQSSSHIEIAGNTLIDSPVGLDITSDAGGANLIEGNAIYGNSMLGVSVSAMNAADTPTVIVGNDVSQNASHGIEVSGMGYTIENNYISQNGALVPGSSGVHTYATSAGSNAGSYNTIRYNVLIGNIDSVAQDGNGVELDQYTHNDTVYGNYASGNDGAGIVLFDSADNVVQDNTLIGNAVDSGKTHQAKAELLLAGVLNLTQANLIQNNSGFSSNASGSAVIVYKQSGGTPQTFLYNLFGRYGAGEIYYNAGRTGTAASTWNGLTGGDDAFGAPPG